MGDGSALPGRYGVFFAGQPQDEGGTTTRQPGCSIPGHQPAGEALLGTGEQRKSTSRMEAQLAAAGSDPNTDHGLSLPSGNQQVEQDRAPAILVYQSELERRTVDQL